MGFKQFIRVSAAVMAVACVALIFAVISGGGDEPIGGGLTDQAVASNAKANGGSITNTSLNAESPDSAKPKRGAYVPNQVVVRYKAGTTGAQRAAARKSIGARLQKKLTIPRAEVLQLDEGTSVKSAAKKIDSESAVDFSEPNYLVHTSLAPNDPEYQNGNLWGLNNTGQQSGTADADIDAPEAWNTQTGGSEVTVAVADTGVDYDHPDLNDSIYLNAGEDGLDGIGNSKRTNGIDDDNNGYKDDWRGYDFSNRDNNPMDDHLHGTHVAGTIAAEGNNNEGVTGVSWAAKIMPLKFLDFQGNGTSAGAAEALDYAGANGAQVLNGSFRFTTDVETQIDKAAIESHPETLYVFAAGNETNDNDGTYRAYPCSHASENIVCVGATDRNDAVANFSNFGATNVDLFAPGVDILSAKASVVTNVSGDYWSLNGTSMASPHVAGAAAVLKSATPSAKAEDLKRGLMNGVDAKPAFTGKVVTGGRLNLNQSLGATSASTTQSVVGSTGGRISLKGSVGGAHNVSVSQSGGDVLVNDSVATLSAGNGCTLVNSHQVSCPAAGVTNLFLAGGNSADTITSSLSLPTVLHGLGGNDTLTGGGGDDRVFGGAGNDTIAGGSGQDVVDYGDHSAQGVTVTLDGVANDGSTGETDNVQSSIENVKGSGRNDTITGSGNVNQIDGSGGNDTIDGAGGNDVLIGGSGADVINGGSGTDVASYADRDEGVTVSIDGVANDGKTAANELDNVGTTVENLIGGSADDTLIGSTGTNVLDGGDGSDTASYVGRSTPVTISLDNTANDGGTGENDFIMGNIENLTGGGGNDTLTGSSSDNILDGGLGADTLNSGGGTDTASYADRTNPVTVTIGSGANDGEPGEGDNVTGSIPNVLGGHGDDTITGDSGNNRLDGGHGMDNDVLNGGDGDDTFAKGLDLATYSTYGADIMNGGPGVDTADYSGIDINHNIPVNVSLDGVQNDGVNGDGGAANANADNVGTDVENVNGGGGNDVLNGNSADNRLIGDGQSDEIHGGGGNDYLAGDGGNTEWALDYCSIQNFGNDLIHGDDGNDVIYGGASFEALQWENNGHDTIHGGDGDDRISQTWDRTPTGICGNYEGTWDLLHGDAGNDTADFSQWNSGAAVSLDDEPNDGYIHSVLYGDPTVIGFANWHSDFEEVEGGTLADLIKGSANADQLNGNDGNDVIDGLGGADVISAGAGTDLVQSAGDGAVDHDICGADVDRVTADVSDTVDADCESGATTTAAISGDQVNVVGAPGASSTIVVHPAKLVATSIVIEDRSHPITAGAGCSQISGLAVSCPPNGINAVNVDAGDQDDTISAWDGPDPGMPVIPHHLNGGSGNDSVQGASSNDVLDGGSGNDYLSGSGGVDAVTYSSRTQAVTASIDGTANDGEAGETDNVDWSTENITGGAGNDTITGSGSANSLVGGGGNDTLIGLDGNDGLTGGSGVDTLNGGNDDDKLRSFDATAGDVNNCGAGADDYTADSSDTVNSDCESVPSAPDTAITSGPATGSEITDNTPAFGFSSNVGHATFECSVDAGAYTACESQRATATLADGSHSFAVRAVDGALVDPSPVSVSFTVDALDGNVRVELHGDDQGTLVIEPDAGTTNDITVSTSIYYYFVEDANSELDAKYPCGNSDPNTVVCWRAGVSNLTASLGSGNDSFTMTPDAPPFQFVTPFDPASTVDGGPGADTLTTASGNDTLIGGSGTDVIDGGAGNDTADYSDHTANLVLTLNGAADDGESGESENIPASIENATGGSGHDLMIGNSGDNVLSGGAGQDAIYANGGGVDAFNGGDDNDWFFPEGSNNTVSGGSGVDKAYFGGYSVDLTISLDDVANDLNGDNIKSDVENVDGGFGNDTITGSGSDNVLHGGDGNDTLSGVDGNDTIDGGAGTDEFTGGNGTDIADYSTRTGGVVLSSDDSANDGAAENDNVHSDIEHLVGGSGNDTIYGSSADNTFDGGDGADMFYPNGGGTDSYNGEGGNDTIWPDMSNSTVSGGSGTDKVEYVVYSSDQTVSLDDVANDGAGSNILSDVENLTGGSGNDTFTGSSADNVLLGGDGNDTLRGGLGADALGGGNGTDHVTYSERTSAISAQINGLADDGASSPTNEGDDIQADIENVTGGSGSDAINGGDANNIINGGDGNDTINGNGGSDVVNGENGNDTLMSTQTADVLNGGADIDHANYSYAATNLTISLDGIANDSGGDNVGADIENVTTGTGNDTIYGNSSNNVLTAGSGTDTVDYTAATGGVTVDLSNSSAQNTGGAGTDTLSGFESVAGSGANDTLLGTSGNNSISGGGGSDTVSYGNTSAAVTVSLSVAGSQNTVGAGLDSLLSIENVTGGNGNDTLSGDAGNNAINGGSGTDTVSYANAPAGLGVIVSLSNTSAQNTGGAGTDTLSSLENLTGSPANDTLSGTSGNNTINAGGGTDTLSYSNATAGVTVNLSTTAAQNTVGAGTDTISLAENVTGSGFDDTLTGTTAANVITGGVGSDTVSYAAITSAVTVNLTTNTATGGGGSDTLATIENAIGGTANDTLTGGTASNVLSGRAGNDVMNGNGGIDTVDYSATGSSVTVNLATTSGQNTVGAGTDTITNTENVIGSAFNDTLTGNTAGNVISGLAGNDVTNGAGGTDTANYAAATAGVTVNLATSSSQNTVGAGSDTITNMENLTGTAFNDTLTGNTLANVITAGLGIDTVSGSSGNDTLVIRNSDNDNTTVCGSGTDVVTADLTPNDPTNADCETVNRA